MTELDTRALLLGGPYHFRSVRVQRGHSRIYVPLPTEVSLMASVDPVHPINTDFRSAIYTIGNPIAYGREIVGYFFEYRGTE